jgi:hypothetical protein
MKICLAFSSTLTDIMKSISKLIKSSLLCLIMLRAAEVHGEVLSPVWKPAKKVDLTEAIQEISKRAKIDPSFVKQPTILAYKTALFLSRRSFDEPTNGRIQSIKADFGPGEEQWEKATVSVEFMGYADDSTLGERYTFTMFVDSSGNWQISEAKREAYGRGDHQ